MLNLNKLVPFHKGTDKSIIIYTDGSCLKNPGIGGWAFLLYSPSTGHCLSKNGFDLEATNNRMELTAVIQALSSLKKRDLTVEIISDSQYVINSASKWLPGWKRKDWKTATGKPVENIDLMKQIDSFYDIDTTWTWVKGHNDDIGNEFVDSLAGEAARKQISRENRFMI